MVGGALVAASPVHAELPFSAVGGFETKGGWTMTLEDN